MKLQSNLGSFEVVWWFFLFPSAGTRIPSQSWILKSGLFKMVFYRGKCNRLSVGLMMIWEGFGENICEEMCVHMVLIGKGGLTSATQEQQCRVWGIWGLYMEFWKGKWTVSLLWERPHLCVVTISSAIWVEGTQWSPTLGHSAQWDVLGLILHEGCDLWVRSWAFLQYDDDFFKRKVIQILQRCGYNICVSRNLLDGNDNEL